MIQVVATEQLDEPSKISSMSFLNMNRDEVATIWYALQEYKQNVLKTVKTSKRNKNPNYIEDEAFCYEQAAKCAQLQFMILDNHDQPIRNQVQTFLDIE